LPQSRMALPNKGMKLTKPGDLGGSCSTRSGVVESGFAAYAQCSADGAFSQSARRATAQSARAVPPISVAVCGLRSRAPRQSSTGSVLGWSRQRAAIHDAGSIMWVGEAEVSSRLVLGRHSPCTGERFLSSALHQTPRRASIQREAPSPANMRSQRRGSWCTLGAVSDGVGAGASLKSMATVLPPRKCWEHRAAEQGHEADETRRSWR